MKTVIPTLMHVDGDPVAGKQLHDAVQIQGGIHRFVQFTCGPAALVQIFAAEGDERRGHPAALVVDMSVDNGCGLDFIISIRSVLELARLPIVVVHDGSHNEDLLIAYQLGISGVLRKPRTGIGWMDLAYDLIQQYLLRQPQRDDPTLLPLYLHRSAVAEHYRP